MKYVYLCGAICLILFGTHLYAFKTGYTAGGDKVKSELLATTQRQTQALAEANKKILDFQRLIGNNNDECFNRLWPDEVINASNPQLR